ncbi:MAG: histidinol-phosphate transaminase [Gammaproteobacteria bacterium]|nr:histidinol-phosphate transaminase [Gammaproteobacteria bacterium]
MNNTASIPNNLTLKKKVEQWVRPEIRALSAYHVPAAINFIKLDAMENPYQWPEAKIEEWFSILADVELNRYPDPNASALKTEIKQAMQVPNGADILLGNGSDEIIQMIVMAMNKPGQKILSVEPGFVMYKMIATFCDMEYIGVPLKEDFSLDMESLLETIRQQQPAVIFLAYPNNPTGNLFDRTDIETIINVAAGLVVIDEAYHAFADSSFMSELARYDNLVVMRTVSKMGLAGLRLGLLAGAKEWLQEFDKVRLPYNINILTQASTRFALANRDMLDTQTEQIKKDRKKLYQSLCNIEGLQVFPSQANFILFRTPVDQADQIFDGLKTDGILIKNLNPAGGMLKDCLRVTVGMPEENQAFLEALRGVMF